MEGATPLPPNIYTHYQHVAFVGGYINTVTINESFDIFLAEDEDTGSQNNDAKKRVVKSPNTKKNNIT